MSIPTSSDYIRCDAQSQWNMPALVISVTKIFDCSGLVGEARISGEREPSHSRAFEKIGGQRKGDGSHVRVE